MSSTLETSRTSTGPLSIEDVRQFLFAEARALDDKDWDAWLACYAPDAEFWMPSWDDDDKLVTDPQSEVSLIYYAHRGGLEDRVFRIKTERSSATSLPEPRTSHNIRVLLNLRANRWVTLGSKHCKCSLNQHMSDDSMTTAQHLSPKTR
jgi:hypothetical protein